MKAAAGDDLQLRKDGNLQRMGVFELKTPIDFVFGFTHNKCTDFPAEPFFGDMTEQVIDDFFRGRSLEKNHMQGILIL